MKHQSRLNRSVLMLALAAAYPVLGYSAAGTAQFTSGDVSVRRGAATQPLAKGSTLESGDAIITGARGLAQVKFSDGGSVSIQPNSQFDITRYADKNDAKEDSFLVNLARGSMRAITGLIGKRNTANYKVTTSTATVGIRGSSFKLSYNADGTLSVATEQDAIEVCTAAGCVGLTAGEAAIVPNATDLPRRSNVVSSYQTDQFRQNPEVAGNQTNSDGTSSIIEGPRVLTGLTFVGAGLLTYEGGADGYLYGSIDGAGVTEGGNLTSYTGVYNDQATLAAGGTATTYYTSGSLATRDYVTLGSWSAGTWSYGEGMSLAAEAAYTPLAFVAGVPTPNESLAALNGMVGEYSLVASTPIFTAHGNGTLESSSHISLQFGTGYSEGSIHLDMTLPYQGSSSSYNLNGYIYGYGSTLNAYASGEGASAEGYGFPIGPDGSKIGLSYVGSYIGGGFSGAGVFGRTSMTQALPGSYYASISSLDGGYVSLYDGEGATVIAGAGGSDVSKFYFPDGPSYYWGFENTGVRQNVATVGSPGSGTYLSLGMWSSSRYFEAEGSPTNYDYTSDYDKSAYIVGTPTLNISSLSGEATYSLYAATPIHMTNGETGTLNSASMTVNFSSGDPSGTLNMGVTLGSLGSHSLSGSVYGTGNATFYAGLSITSGGEGGADAYGFFSGDNAEYAGFTYRGYHYGSEYTYFGGGAILYGDGVDPEYTPVIGIDSGTYGGLRTLAFGGDFNITGGTPFTSGEYVFDGDHTVAGSGGYGGVSAGTNGSYNFNGSVAQSGSHGEGDNFIGWGKWSSGSAYTGSSYSLDNAHYITGKPTPSDHFSSLSGTVSYTPVGWTNPVSSVAGEGQLTGATLTADFTGLTASASVNTSFNGGANTLAMTANNMPISTASAMFSGTATLGAAGRISGMFVGDYASKAGFVYQMQDGTLGRVSGSVAFQAPSPQ
jgi:hypothetical protein